MNENLLQVGDQMLDSKWQIALHTQSKHASKTKYYSIQVQQIEKHNNACQMPPYKKAQQREDVRMKVSMYTHTQSHKYSNNNCTTILYTIHGTPALLVYSTIKQQCSTSWFVQGSVTVEWEATVLLQYWRNYCRLQGTAVLDSATSTVRRRQFCLTRQQHLKNSIKQHHGGRTPQPAINQHSNKNNWQLTNKKESKVWLLGKERRGKGANGWNSMQWACWHMMYKVEFWKEMRQYLEKFMYTVLQQAIPWLHKMAFAETCSRGSTSFAVTCSWSSSSSSRKVVVAAAGVGVTYGDNHNQHTAPYKIHQYTIHGTSYPPYAVPAFLMDIKVMKTKAQERYGNTSRMKIFLINWKKDTSDSWST